VKKNLEDLEFAYTIENNKTAAGEYFPIRTAIQGRTWFPTLQEALAAQHNDLRWRPKTFIISRPKPESPQRFEVPAELQLPADPADEN